MLLEFRQMIGPVMMNPVLRKIKPLIFNFAEKIKKT